MFGIHALGSIVTEDITTYQQEFDYSNWFTVTWSPIELGAHKLLGNPMVMTLVDRKVHVHEITYLRWNIW